LDGQANIVEIPEDQWRQLDEDDEFKTGSYPTPCGSDSEEDFAEAEA